MCYENRKPIKLISPSILQSAVIEAQFPRLIDAISLFNPLLSDRV